MPDVAKNVNGVVIISSPGLTSRAIKASNKESVPDAHDTALFSSISRYAAACFSKFLTSEPKIKPWLSKILLTASSASGLISANARPKSKIGTLIKNSSNEI